MSYHQIIYNRLRQHGITEAGALGVLGNFECESNCEPYRLQGDFSSYRTASKAYVQGVTNGSISRETFSKDAKGFGIYQLTYWTRKQGYYDFWKQSGKALDDAELQVDYAIKEMQSDYPQLLSFLKATTDVYTACSRVCKEFERPAVNNIDARYSAANRIKYEIDLSASTTAPTTAPTTATEDKAEETVVQADDHSLNLRTIDEHCSDWDEVWLLQSILKCRGYMTIEPHGKFENFFIEIVKNFQRNNGLTADGVVGPKTWDKLLER